LGRPAGEEMKPLIGLDSMVFIYLFELNREHLEEARRVLREVEAGTLRAVTSTLTLTEIMVKPLREGRKNEALDYAFTIENFPNLTVKAPDVAIAIKAAELRAVYDIKTPDALHLATAITSGAEVFVSQDVGLKRVKEIAVCPLRDALTQFKDDAGV